LAEVMSAEFQFRESGRLGADAHQNTEFGYRGLVTHLSKQGIAKLTHKLKISHVIVFEMFTVE